MSFIYIPKDEQNYVTEQQLLSYKYINNNIFQNVLWNKISKNDNIVAPTGVYQTLYANEIEITEGITGSSGPTGQTDPTGITGPIGSSLTGNTGPTGITGSQGIIGNTGPTGLQRSTGYTGWIGSQGQIRPTGSITGTIANFTITNSLTGNTANFSNISVGSTGSSIGYFGKCWHKKVCCIYKNGY